MRDFVVGKVYIIASVAGGLVYTKDNKLIAEIPIGGAVKIVAPRQQLDITDPDAVIQEIRNYNNTIGNNIIYNNY
jgi:hypothetical protein